MNALLDLGLLTLSDVAELLHCSKAHVCKTVSGRVRGCPPIPAVSLGRRKLMRRKRTPSLPGGGAFGCVMRTAGLIPQTGKVPSVN
jgi:hypothetical protein